MSCFLLTRGQFAEDTEKYREVLEKETALLEEQIKSDPYVEEVFYPERASEMSASQSGQKSRSVYFDPDEYVFQPPHPQLYTIGMLLDPCKGSTEHGCCDNAFGAPIYGRLKRDLVDMGYRRQTESLYNPFLVEASDEILENVDLVDSTGADVNGNERRRSDDETYISEECAGVREGLGADKVQRPYMLGTDGKLVRSDKYTYCQGSRLGHRPYGEKPACVDNNATVDATAECTDLDGKVKPYCVQVAFSQTAVIVSCGKSSSPNVHDFSTDGHCGTFLEVHRENGSPYNPDENYILAEKRIEPLTTSGYTTMTIDMTYGQDNGTGTRILCDYEESSIRLGSMVFVLDSAPECCCPGAYNNDRKTGHFFCPKNAFDDTSGPFADSLKTLAKKIAHNLTVDTYPYCPVLPEGTDQIHCSQNFTTPGGVSRFFSYECTGLSNATTPTDDDDAPVVPNKRTSDFLVGGDYAGQCFYYGGCGSHPFRSGEYGEGEAAVADVALRALSCPAECPGASCGADSYFSFIGLVGKVTCAPTDEVKCIVYDGDKFEDDEEYYLVTFNDGRTSYPFRSGDLKLHQPVSNYQLWWVQRTRHNFIVQQKKGFHVSSPTCTFDAVNDRYFPYTIVSADGTYIDTYYGEGG